MTAPTLLHARHLALDTPNDRPLFRDLSITLDRLDRVAVVGRNGVGKSSLIQVLAGHTPPTRGQLACVGKRLLVPQRLPPLAAGPLSPGEQRRQVLDHARTSQADLLLLDEPSHDLDRAGIAWLVGWLATWRGGLVVVSHDRRVLSAFDCFFVVAESGCRLVRGTLSDLLEDLEQERREQERRYASGLSQLRQQEKRSAADRQRRTRKKHLGRVREIKRATARIKLNEKRSYAQEKQAKRTALRNARIESARQTALNLRRAVPVVLPLHVPTRPTGRLVTTESIVSLEAVSARAGERSLFGPLSLDVVSHERLAIVGANGAGKTTLAEILCGLRKPHTGAVRVDSKRVGYIAQNGSNWCGEQSVMETLLMQSQLESLEDAVRRLEAHRFPLALAQRPLATLSPGERVRAALVCLMQREPLPELLILDEPTGHLDFLGVDALEAVLRAWTGGLVMISHDDDFLERVGIRSQLVLEAGCARLREDAA